jgi:hypothetical protein
LTGVRGEKGEHLEWLRLQSYEVTVLAQLAALERKLKLSEPNSSFLGNRPLHMSL